MPGGISGLYPSLARKRREQAEGRVKEAKAAYDEAKLMLKEAKRVERLSTKKKGKNA